MRVPAILAAFGDVVAAHAFVRLIRHEQIAFEAQDEIERMDDVGCEDAGAGREPPRKTRRRWQK